MKKVILSGSVAQTQSIAESIGSLLRGGEVIELISDLGGGKTTFVQGLTKGIDTQDKVSSPSFTISKVYIGENLTIHHFDFYRLNDPGLQKYELRDLLNDPKAVIVIEWGEIVRNMLPKEKVQITLKPLGLEKRELTFNYPQTLSYLFSEDVNTDN